MNLYFPFTRGIPFSIGNKGVINSKMDADHWFRLFDNRTAVICCFGGLLENICALPIAEVLSQLMPGTKIEWACPTALSAVWEMNGLGTKHEKDINQDFLTNYFSPMFYYGDDYTYINTLYNYIFLYNFAMQKIKRSRRTAFYQIYKNIMVPWSYKYFPKMRKVEIPKEFANHARLYKYDLSKPFILLCPDDLLVSQHFKKDYLKWGLEDVRSFAGMVNNSKYNLIIITHDIGKYYGLKSLVYKPDLEVLLYLISKSYMVISKNVDVLYGAQLLNNNSIIMGSVVPNRVYNSYKLKRYIESENRIIFPRNGLKPIDAFRRLA